MGAELLEDHAYSDPSRVVVQLGVGEATTDNLQILQLLGGGAPRCWGRRSDPWGVRGGGGGGRWLRGNLDHLEELVGELRDVLEPLGRPFGPRVFAVAVYLARGAVAQTVLQLDVHAVYGALIRYCRARGDAVLLLRVDVEYVVEPTRGSLQFGSVVYGPCSVS